MGGKSKSNTRDISECSDSVHHTTLFDQSEKFYNLPCGFLVELYLYAETMTYQMYKSSKEDGE